MPFRKRRPGKRGNWYLPGFIVVSVLAAFFNPPDPGVTSGEFEYVQRVVDGDTLVLGTGERVRLIGVNTPETVHPKKAVEAFGKEASAFTKRMVEGKLVRLEFDPVASRRSDGKDRYSRTLAYVFLQDGRHLNAEIIRQGYGFAVSSSPPLNRGGSVGISQSVKLLCSGYCRKQCTPSPRRNRASSRDLLV